MPHDPDVNIILILDTSFFFHKITAIVNIQFIIDIDHWCKYCGWKEQLDYISRSEIWLELE